MLVSNHVSHPCAGWPHRRDMGISIRSFAHRVMPCVSWLQQHLHSRAIEWPYPLLDPCVNVGLMWRDKDESNKSLA